MKNQSDKIHKLISFIETHKITSVSLDIDGTLYPLRRVKFIWWMRFFLSPFMAIKFLTIRKKWEKRRLGKPEAILAEDLKFFEEFLSSMLDPSMVPDDIRIFLKAMADKKINVTFLSDHGSEKKLKRLGLNGDAVNCLEVTGELKPHPLIAEYMLKNFDLVPGHHLHVGDRWTDEKQAALMNAHYFYLEL